MKKKSKKKKSILKNIKKKLRGFTLVELLAVIVILAIIMVIAIPSVLSTMSTARQKSFIEYIAKVRNLAEKQYLEDEMMGNITDTCTMYEVGKEIGLDSTGDYNGYVVAVKEGTDVNYYITLYDSTYMVYGIQYTSDLSTKDLNKFTDSSDENLTKANLASLAGCSSFTNKSDGSTETAAVTETKIVKEYKSSSYAVWVWDNPLSSILADESKMIKSAEFMSTLGVKEAYLTIMPENLNDANTVSYITKLNKAGVKVWILYGDPIFVKPAEKKNVVDYDMNAVKNFNDTNSSAHIEGIHYDVEYWGYKYDGTNTCPDGETEAARTCVARKYYVQFVKAAYAKSRELGLKVGFDITVYTTHLANYYDDDGTLKNVLEEVIDYGDEWAVMAYGNCPYNSLYSLYIDGTFNHGDGVTIPVKMNFIKMMQSHNKTFLVGQELQRFSETATWMASNYSSASYPLNQYVVDGVNTYKYNWEFINGMFNSIETELNGKGVSNVNIAIHDYLWLEKLLG